MYAKDGEQPRLSHFAGGNNIGLKKKKKIKEFLSIPLPLLSHPDPSKSILRHGLLALETQQNCKFYFIAITP